MADEKKVRYIRLKPFDQKAGQVHKSYHVGGHRFVAGGPACAVTDEALVLKLSEMEASSPRSPLMFEVSDEPFDGAKPAPKKTVERPRGPGRPAKAGAEG